MFHSSAFSRSRSPAPLMPPTVFIVSDGTGITAETFAHSILSQFDQKFRLVRVPFVDATEKAYATLEKINEAAHQERVEPDRERFECTRAGHVPDLCRAARTGTGAEVEPRDGPRPPERRHRGVQEPDRGDQLLARAR